MKGTFLKFLTLSVLFFPQPLVLAAETQDHNGSTTPYTVKKGDCLWNISKRFYQNPFQWPLVYHHNQTLIQNPEKIDIGWMLVIPEGVGPEEVNQAVRFALDYKGLAQEAAHRRMASPGQTARQVAEKNQLSAPDESAKPAENPQVSSAAQEGPAASNVPGQAPSNAAGQSPVPSQQAGGSLGTIVAVIGVVVLACLGIRWWRTRQSRKQVQEPYRLSQAPEAGETASSAPPATVAPPAGPPASQPAPPIPPQVDVPPDVPEQPGQAVSTQEQLFEPTSSAETPAQAAPQTTEPPPVSAGGPAQADSSTSPETPIPSPAPGEKPKDENHRDVA